MTPQDAAEATAPGITDIASKFMLDPGTYSRGAELGFGGFDFYVTGRGGVLGPVDADIVAAAFVWFEPSAVRGNWEAGCAVMAPLEAAEAFAACAHSWAEAHVPDDLDAARLADLAGRVVGSAGVGGAPLFAGWRRLPLPSSPKALAVHHLNGLRELRGALHGGAALAAGLRPLEALLVKTPYMAPMFGWSEPLPEVSHLSDRWQQAEDGTNRAMATALAGLEEGDRAELAGLVEALREATAG